MKKTVSVLGIALLMGTVVLAQTSSTATRKSGKSKKSSDASASTQSGSSADSSQPGDTSASTNSTSAGAQGSDSSQVKAGNSGFDDTSSSTTAATGTTSGQSDTQTGSPSAGTSGQMSAMQSSSGAAQTISNGPVAETVADTTVVVGWATHDAASNTGIKYGTNRANMTETAQGIDGSDGKNHHARLQGLQPSTRYYFQVTENGSPVGGVGTFKTTASGEAPVQSKAIIPQK